jgi:DNA-binding NtrC family response regulator
MDATPGPRRILVVDDEPLMRWSVAEALSDQGFDVVSRGDAQSARAAVMDAACRFDAVLLDLQLPDSVDLSLLRALRTLTPQTALILMTAFATPELRRDALESGAFCVLDKPFEMDAVAGVVSDAAGHFPGAAN